MLIDCHFVSQWLSIIITRSRARSLSAQPVARRRRQLAHPPILHHQVVVMANALTTSPLVQDLPSWTTTSSLDVRAWLNKLTQLKLALGSTDEQIIRFVALKVNCNRSMTYVSHLIVDAEAAGVFDWNAFKASMIGEFEVVSDPLLVEAALSSMRQKPNQTLMEYAKAFELEASRSTTLDSNRKCHTFISTLQPEGVQYAARIGYTNACMAGAAPSVQRIAASLALLADYGTSSSRVVNPSVPQATSMNAATSARQERSFDNRRHQGSQRDYGRQSDRNWPSSSNNGQVVARSDHHSPSANVQSTSQDVRQTGVCYKCGSKDHWANNCTRFPARTVSAINDHDQESFTADLVVNNSVLSTALVDTGAQANVVRSSFVNRLWPRPVIVSSDRHLTGPNHEPLDVVGECVLEIILRAHNIRLSVQFTVVSNCTSEVNHLYETMFSRLMV